MLDTVSFSQDAFHATILLPALIDFPMENLRKIFKLMLWDDRVNERAIQDTTLFLESIVPGSKAAWHAASVKYQQEWRLIEKPIIRAHNNELTRTVKKAKSQYERWVKIQALWNDTKHKMNIK